MPAYQSLDEESRKDKKSCGKICANKDHNNNYQLTVMSEYGRHHNVKSWGWSKTLIKLHGPTANSEFQALNLTQRHKFLFTRHKGDAQHPTSATHDGKKGLLSGVTNQIP